MFQALLPQLLTRSLGRFPFLNFLLVYLDHHFLGLARGDSLEFQVEGDKPFWGEFQPGGEYLGPGIARTTPSLGVGKINAQGKGDGANNRGDHGISGFNRAERDDTAD